MIDSVKQIVTLKASDLPPTFDIRIGAMEYPFELESMDAHFVYMRSTSTDETVNIPRDEMITILIPDTWENAKWDIALGLMQEGVL
jgi:hypothetical protein